MKSELAKVTRVGDPLPHPAPMSPPVDMPNMPVSSCAEDAARVVDGVVGGMEPAVDALLDVMEVRGREPGRREEQGGTDEQPGGPISGHVQDDDEQAEQQHRGTQVLLEDQDADAHAPHNEQGAQVPGARQAHPQDLAAHQARLSRLANQVGG